jgi:hypothetical protein
MVTSGCWTTLSLPPFQVPVRWMLRASPMPQSASAGIMVRAAVVTDRDVRRISTSPPTASPAPAMMNNPAYRVQ